MTTVQSALMSAFMLGRSGHPNTDFLEELANKVKEGDSAVWQELASLEARGRVAAQRGRGRASAQNHCDEEVRLTRFGMLPSPAARPVIVLLAMIGRLGLTPYSRSRGMLELGPLFG